MTTPEPTDRELKKLDEDAMIERSDRGDDPFMSDVLAYRRRVLFTAGERRGIDRCIEKLKSETERPFGQWIAPQYLVAALESLRDTPAGEQTHGPLRKGEAFKRRVAAAGPLEVTLLAGSPPAKPEAAGEEPALLKKLRGPWSSVGVDVRTNTGEIGELLAFVDCSTSAMEEPAVLTRLRKHCGRVSHPIDWRELLSLLRYIDKLQKDRPAPAAKEAGELEPEQALVHAEYLLGIGIVLPTERPTYAPNGYGYEVLTTLRALGFMPPHDCKARLRDMVVASVDAARADREERDRLRARVATLEAGLDEFIRTEETSGVENERDLWFFYRELKKLAELRQPPQPTEQRPDPRAAK